MSKQVKLIITGIQQDEDGNENITETVSVAEYHDKDGTQYLFFEENADDLGPVKSTIKLKHNTLELTKKGIVTTKMIFSQGTEYLTDYMTPFGTISMGILTHSLHCTLLNGFPQVKIRYTLTSGGEPVSKCTLTIKIHP